MELKREAYTQESTGITKNKCYKEKIIKFKKEVFYNSDYLCLCLRNPKKQEISSIRNILRLKCDFNWKEPLCDPLFK